MVKTRKRLIMVIIAIFVITMGAAAVYAAPSTVKLAAYQGIKIIYNGTELASTDQSYIINNRTYVPLRLLMDNFGKNVSWDAANNQVIINDGGSYLSQMQQLDNQIATLQKKNAELENTINSLNSQTTSTKTKTNTSTVYDYNYDYEDEEDDDTSVSDIKAEVADYFEDAGSDYFGDNGIGFSLSLSGDEDELTYTIRLDFDDADYYQDLTDISQSRIEDFMDDVKARISSEANDTDYEDADIEGKLIDSSNTSHFVSYDGSYSFSWDEDDTTVEDIEEAVADYFVNCGDTSFGDSGVVVNISIDGDKNELEYDISIDCSASGSADLHEISQGTIKAFLTAVKYQISDEADGTNFEDADITGRAYDANNSADYNVEYNGSSYNFSW